MKKEVVHVPTRGLAEKVLRVAKENGLYKDYDLESMLKQVKQDDLCIRPGLDFGFASFGYFEDKEYKVITAQEFLSRYTPKFRPIAMRCNKEQFDAVKSKLDGFEFGSVFNFDIYKYLVNNNSGREMNVTNVNTPGTEYNRQVFEEWNEKTFLEYCGIEVKEEVSEVDRLRKENAELKKQLQAIEDQPKVGDVCLFWDGLNKYYSLEILSEIIKGKECIYRTHNNDEYANCIKATDENVKAKIKELQDGN